MLVESARAVDNEIVGNDSDAELIGEYEFKNACSCALLAASSAAAADCASALFLGDVVKNWAILLAFADVFLTKAPPFSFGEKDGQGMVLVGELLKGFDRRRGMAKRWWYDVDYRGIFDGRRFSVAEGILERCEHAILSTSSGAKVGGAEDVEGGGVFFQTTRGCFEAIFPSSEIPAAGEI